MMRFWIVTPMLLAILLVSIQAGAQTVAIVAASPQDGAAAEQLAAQIDYEATLRATQNAHHPDALIVEAREGWPEDLVVVIDTQRAIVHVLRPWDGTHTSRSLDPAAAAAPYAVALAAVELLELVERAPPAKAASLPPRKAAAPPDRPAVATPALSLGGQLASSVDGDVSLLQPLVGVDLQVHRYPSPLLFVVGLHAAGLTSKSRRQLLLLPTPDSRGRVSYRRDELGLHVGLGHRQGVGSALGALELGLTRTDVTSRDGVFENEVARDERLAFWAGLGGALRYRLVAGWALSVGVSAAWFPVPTRFLASPEGTEPKITALEEGSLELRMRWVLVWEAGP